MSRNSKKGKGVLPIRQDTFFIIFLGIQRVISERGKPDQTINRNLRTGERRSNGISSGERALVPASYFVIS